MLTRRVLRSLTLALVMGTATPSRSKSKDAHTSQSGPHVFGMSYSFHGSMWVSICVTTIRTMATTITTMTTNIITMRMVNDQRVSDDQ